MSFNWVDFLTLADALSRTPNTPGPEEAALRSAVSRAYYAAFCSARTTARDKEGFVPTGSPEDHRLLRNHFRARGDRVRRKISTDLERLRDNRNRADYDDLLVTGPAALAQSSVAVARNIIGALHTL